MKKKISAILSAYRSEKFIAGCIDNILQQTIANDIEIIVINSASLQDEERVISEYLKKFENIKYFKTKSRESIYASWNRAIKLASGKYLINTNADDRSRLDAFEIMARALDSNPGVAIVYSDIYITEVPNDTIGFRKRRKAHWEIYRAPDYSHKELLVFPFLGQRNMWRAGLHREMGFFDERYRIAADYDFWLRVAERYPMLHIPDFLCLTYYNKKSISKRNEDLLRRENMTIRKEYYGF